MSDDPLWFNRPCERLDRYDEQNARAEAGTMPTLADLARPRCATCRGDLDPGQYAIDGQPWCPRCEPERAKPLPPCACGAVAEVWFYDLAEPLGCCARCAAPHLARMAAR